MIGPVPFLGFRSARTSAARELLSSDHRRTPGSESSPLCFKRAGYMSRRYELHTWRLPDPPSLYKDYVAGDSVSALQRPVLKVHERARYHTNGQIRYWFGIYIMGA